MSGPRYTGWHHTRIVGDRDAGSVYLPEARTLLGYVMDEAERNQLGVHSARRELKDGTVLIAEKHGAIPRVTIIPAGSPGEEIKLRVPNDFVVWARDAGHTAGIDADHPQQILRAKKAKPAGTAGGNGGIHAAEGGGAAADVSWQTFFFNSEVEGYEDFALAKGTYGGLFPGGVPRAGNVDWCGEDGERISWYGPSSRYFFDVFHQPRSQYDKKVFMQGRAILDVDDYLAHSLHDAGFTEHYVLGAALRKDNGTWWLYVAQADLPMVATSTATIPANTIFFGESLPLADVPVRICRYAMLTSDAHPALELSVAYNSREALWAGVITSGVQTWIFDAACGRAVTFAANTNATATTSTYVPGLAGAPGETDTWYTATITRDEDGSVSVAMTTTAVSQTEGNKATLARDFKDGAAVDLLVSRSTQFNTPAAPVLSLGGASWPLHYREAIAGGYRYFKRWLLHADLREGEVLFFVQDVTVPDDVNVALSGETWVELWRGGARITSIQALGGAVTTTGLPQAVATLVDASLSDLYNRASGYALAPSWFVYGQVGYAYGTTVGGAFAGIAPMFCVVWPPADELYGSYGARATTPGAPTAVASQRDASFADNSADFDGHTSAISCATVDNVTVFSVPAFAAGNDASLSFADDSPLGALTGVAGANARYHPSGCSASRYRRQPDARAYLYWICVRDSLGSQSFESIFNGGSIEIRTGTQPDNADMPATGTVIARVTRDGGAWAAGSLANGLQFTRSGRYAMKPYDHVWQLKGSASGVAGWFRLVGNAPDDGSASLSLPRIDGTVRLDESVGDGQLILITTNLDASTTIAIDNWWYAIPPIGD